jgi:hypothetical protein
VLDWGQGVSGYLTLRFAEPAAPVGAAYFGLHMPDPQRQGPDAYIVGTPGQGYWEDVVPRRFRFVLLVAVPDIVDARLMATDAMRLEPIPGGQPQPGVLGLQAPRLGSPIEDEVWRKLERFPR